MMMKDGEAGSSDDFAGAECTCEDNPFGEIISIAHPDEHPGSKTGRVEQHKDR